jgi:hypothetical protein
MKDVWIELSDVEAERTYIFSDGYRQTIQQVNKVKVSSSGTHYLETVDGEKWIIAARWVAIKLKVAAWTF